MEELLVKYFSGEATEVESAQVVEWRGASKENAEEFLSYKKTWTLTSARVEVDQSILNGIIGDSTDELKIVPIWKQRSFQVAASVIVILCAVFYLLKSDVEDQPFGQVVAVKTTFELPDGSSVTVQKGGSIDLIDFSEVREVAITGKVYFDVERDESKAFLINTEGAIIKVLGTSFVVNANEHQHSTEVMVESGVVSLGQNPKTFGANSMEIRLNKGEMGIIQIGERGIKKKKISDANYLSWQNEIITFKNARLREVSNTLEDVYGLSIDFVNPSLEKCSLTAKFNKKTADEVMNIIAETFQIEVTKTGDKIVFDGEACQ